VPSVGSGIFHHLIPLVPGTAGEPHFEELDAPMRSLQRAAEIVFSEFLAGHVQDWDSAPRRQYVSQPRVAAMISLHSSPAGLLKEN